MGGGATGSEVQTNCQVGLLLSGGSGKGGTGGRSGRGLLMRKVRNAENGDEIG